MFAPSTEAASIGSRGIANKPASKVNVTNGVQCQTSINTIAIQAWVVDAPVLNSQPKNLFKKKGTGPWPCAIIKRQVAPTAIGATTTGNT